MGVVSNGVWRAEDSWSDARGEFVRAQTTFRAGISSDGSTSFPVAPGRYHLYVSWACPWAHRVIITRRLKGLENVIGMSVTQSFMGDDGWDFGDEPGATPSSVAGFRFLREIYLEARPDFTGRVTVPILWDRETRTIVNNESREIARMLDLEFDSLAERRYSLYPRELATEIEAAIDALFPNVNDGVYRAGFASTQAAYERAVRALFEDLDRYEALLGTRRYLCGDVMTLADTCLFATLVRFDVVYHYHFKCNLRRIADYPRLSAYLREIYQVPGVAETCNFEHIKSHYFRSHGSINPHRIVPVGPAVDLGAPHGREGIGRG